MSAAGLGVSSANAHQHAHRPFIHCLFNPPAAACLSICHGELQVVPLVCPLWRQRWSACTPHCLPGGGRKHGASRDSDETEP